MSGKIRLPPQNASHQAFLTAARVMVSEATGHRDLMVKHGMPGSMLDEVGQVLNDYEQATEVARGSTRARINAGAELESVVSELVDVISLLDGLNRYRFREQEELLHTWASVTNVLGPFRPKKPEPEPPAAGEGGLPSAA